jgi:hypothetical protein
MDKTESNTLTDKSLSLRSYNPLIDISVVSILIANLISIYLVYQEGWTLFQVLWIYWFQSVTIGFFSFLKILTLKKFSTKNLKFNGESVKPTESTKRKLALFFLFHFGGFHLVYFIFLAFLGGDILELNLLYLGLTLIAFFVGHTVSFFTNLKREQDRVPNVGRIMALPYIRVLPMHITLLLGGVFDASVLPLFLFLKTISDLTMHIVEHKIRSSGAESAHRR